MSDSHLVFLSKCLFIGCRRRLEKVCIAPYNKLALLCSGFFSREKSNCTSSKPIRMDTLAFLGEAAPAFPVRGCQVRVLTEPSDFFEQLCTRAAASTSRIAMAALYLGTGDKAKSLVDSVRKSLQSTGGRTRTIFLLDYCRGNRNVEGKSSCSMLQPLLQEYKVIALLCEFD